jgi:hypothetical protein
MLMWVNNSATKILLAGTVFAFFRHPLRNLLGIHFFVRKESNSESRFQNLVGIHEKMREFIEN